MKNLKVTMKLTISFSVVVALAIFIGLVGILGMNTINRADDDLYKYNVIALQALGSIRENFVMQQRDLRTCMIRESTHPNYKAARQRIATLQEEMEAHIAQYYTTITSDEDEELYTRFNNALVTYEDALEEMLSMTDVDNLDESLVLLDEIGAPAAAEVTSILADAVTYNVNAAQTAVEGNTSLYKQMAVVEAVVIVVTIAFAVFIITYISKLISKPLGLMAQALDQIGTKGDLRLNEEMQKSAGECTTWKDEIGVCARAVVGLIEHLASVESDLEQIASGDLTINVNTLSDRDNIGISVAKLVENLNRMFSEINTSTAQVSNGSAQIASGAQALAQGSTEQASAVEQLSSSIAEIAEKTRANAEMADKAANLAHTIMSNAEKGSRQMDDMMAAVKEINQASQSINKVIKVIDEIAFQTNILALNAAVEAARAGQHGKGFAVVAEEVRNLAAKSAEAAKDTEELIANSMDKASLGVRIADETASSLAEIVSGIDESNQLVSNIARSSEEQSEGISQINNGIEQVAQVVQQNSATAQQSAAASEEMSGQAEMLDNLVSQFRLKDTGGSRVQRLPSGGRNAFDSGRLNDGGGIPSNLGKY